MKNPSINGAIIVETRGPKAATECYHGPARYSKPMKVYGGTFPNGFNPKKVVFFGEEVVIYAKNATIKFDLNGNASFLPVDNWIDTKGLVEEKVLNKYGLKV